ncbi:fibronectin type III domain-containing protein [Geomonas terrae]|uniref:Fibronectin type III domain-containing protein n=1 Tax=Geomonas terrae TaxID=2562681 RepID=A0A4S1CAP6_9BACT|nr:fibronectin type III domain-containing protein [Geomonas terrae]TGU70203.1 fibronectin type III domain-containing protein [Geomonas terrae]
MVNTLKLDFLRAPIPARIVKGRVIIAAMTGNPFFPEPWSEHTTTLARLNEVTHNLEVSHLESLGGGKGKIAMRVLYEKEYAEEFRSLAAYVTLVAKGDMQKLTASGFDVTKAVPVQNKKHAHETVPVFEVKQGAQRGSVLFRAKSIAGAASFEVHFAVGDPAVESNWKHGAVFARCTGMELGGLTAGVDHYFRMRAITNVGPGPWSPPLPFMPT